jgi:hypothetical protein
MDFEATSIVDGKGGIDGRFCFLEIACVDGGFTGFQQVKGLDNFRAALCPVVGKTRVK